MEPGGGAAVAGGRLGRAALALAVLLALAAAGATAGALWRRRTRPVARIVSSIPDPKLDLLDESTMLLVASETGHAAELWSVSSGERLRVFELPGPILGHARTGDFVVCHERQGPEPILVVSVSSGRTLEIPLEAPFADVALAPSDRTLSVLTVDRRVSVHALPSGARLAQLSVPHDWGEPSYTAADTLLSADATLFAARVESSWGLFATRDGSLAFVGSQGKPSVFASDGNLVTRADEAFQLRSPRDAHVLGSVPVPNGWVNLQTEPSAFAIGRPLPEGDGFVWEVRTLDGRLRFQHAQPRGKNTVSLGHGGDRIAIECEPGTIEVWDVPP